MLQQYYISHLSLRIFASEYDLIKVLIGYSLLATINSEVFEVWDRVSLHEVLKYWTYMKLLWNANVIIYIS